MKKCYLAVISVDALVAEDIPTLLTYPNFSRIFTNAARVERVTSIYPTLTHPVHAALITGCTAGKTGVISNEIFPPLYSEKWYNELSQIKGLTLFHAAKAAGMTSAASRWPVTARGNEIIDYIIPEVIGDVKAGKPMEEALIWGGAGPIMEDIVLKNIGLLWDGNARPGYDIFGAVCASDIVRKYKPNLLFSHPGIVDSARHKNGLFGEAIEKALAMADEWIGLLAKAYQDAGIWEDTNFVVLSDHGQLETKRSVRLNALFAQEGLLSVDENGRVASYDAYVCSTGLSAQVYLKDKNDKVLEKLVWDYLNRLLERGDCGFSQILTKEESNANYGLWGDFTFVLETDGFTSFSEDPREPIFISRESGDYRVNRATHGHMPHKGPQPVFWATGSSFKKNAVLPIASILDIAPTLARTIGLSLPDADGKPLDELLK